MRRRRPSQGSHRRWITNMMSGSRRFAPALVLGGMLLAFLGTIWGFTSLPALALGLVCGPLAFHHALRYYRESGESDWMAMCLFIFAGWPLVQLAADPEFLSRIERTAISVQYFGAVLVGWGLFAGWRFRHEPPPEE